MKKDIIQDSLICLANAKLNDTSYEVARDIALDYIIDLQERINKAIEYIENVKTLNEEDRYTTMKWEYGILFPKLLNILKGEE